jgi:hypothetical protein
VAKFGNNGNRGNFGKKSGGGKWKHKRNGNKGGRPYDKDHKGSRKFSHDPNKYCTFHQAVGHNIFECRQAKKEKDKNGDKGDGNANEKRKSQSRSESYQPSFSFPGSFDSELHYNDHADEDVCVEVGKIFYRYHDVVKVMWDSP